MTARALADKLSLRCIAGEKGLDKPVDGGYMGDLLSWVMGRAQAGSAWITVMGNVNAVAVAVLAEISCILLCENAPLDEDARVRAEENDIPVLAGQQDAFSLALALGRALELQG